MLHFVFLCEKLGPTYKRRIHIWKITFSIKSRVVVLLQKLGVGNMFHSVGEIYGMVESLISIIVRKFCKLMKVQLYVQFWNESWFQVMANEFETLHRILDIIGVVNGLHISIIALVIGGLLS